MRLKWFPLLVVFISAFTLFESCRKTGKGPEKDEVSTSLEKQDKFYNDYPSTDPHIIKLNAYLNRINKGNDFVKLTIERVGYPIWNKTQIVRTSAGNGRGLADSITFSYIPFSEPNEEVVNACLIVRTSSNDTLAWWVCDWQYHDMPHGNTGTPGTAENTAMFFMEFQHIVFGDTSFVITDSTLFANPSWPAWGTGKRKVRIRQTSSGGRTGRSADQVIQCTDIYYCGSPWASECIPDCDYLYCHYGMCYLVDQQCECIMNCGGSGGDPYGDPPPGGGGTGGGGGTPPPPECIPFASRTANAVPGECPPGWMPPNDDPPPPLPNEDSLIGQNLKRLIQKVNGTADSLHAAAQQNGKERTFTFIRTPSNDTVPMWVREGTSHTSSPILTSYSFAILHTHQEDDLTAVYYKNECFDGPDIYKLYKNVAIDGYPIEVSIVTTREYYYAAVITNPVKFRDFIRSICGSQNLEEIYQQLSYKHSDAMDGCTIMPLCNWQKKTELGVLSITANNNSSISGIKIYRSPKQTLNFTLLTP